MYVLLSVLILELCPYVNIYNFPAVGIIVDQLNLAEAVAIKQQWAKEMPDEPEVSITKVPPAADGSYSGDSWHFTIAGA